MKKKSLLFFLLILFGIARIFAQPQLPAVTGPNPVLVGATETYSFTMPSVSAANDVEAVITVPAMSNTVGEIVKNGNVCTVEITWNTPGRFIIVAKNSGGGSVASTRDNQDVIVNKPPVGPVSISGGISSKCQGALNDTQHPFVANASNANSYSWSISSSDGSPGSISSSGVVNWSGTFSGTATISVTAWGDAGSSSSSSVQVTVNPYDVVTFTANNHNQPICQYGSVNLTASNVSQDFYLENQNNTSEHWGPNSGIWNNGNISLSLSLSQSTTFRLDANPRGGCIEPNAPSKYVTIEVTPRPVVGSITPTLAPFCQGSRTTDSFVFSDPGNNSISPTWSVSDNGAGTFSGNQMSWNPNFHGGVNIIVTVQGIGGCAGISQSGTLPVQVKPRPIISAVTADKCSGEGANFSLTSSTDNTFVETSISWSVSGASASASPSSGNGTYINPTLSNTTTTSQTLSFTVYANQDGCTSTTTIPLTVKPRPSFSPDPSGTRSLCSEADAVVALGSNVSGTTYRWGVSAPGVSGAQEQTTYINTSEMRQTLTTGSSENSATYTFTPQANGCQGGVAVVRFDVKPKPTLSLSGTSYSVCNATTPNPTITLSNPNNVSGTIYSWNASADGISGIAASGSSASGTALSIPYILVNTSVPGSVSYTNIVASANGCSSPPQSLWISVLASSTPPAGVAGNYRFLAGPLTLSVSGASGSEQFKWSDANDQNPVVSNSYVVPNVTQNASNFMNVRRSVGGCWSLPRWFDVFVMPVPTITASQAQIVKSQPVLLTTQSGYDEYVWNRSGGNSTQDDTTFPVTQPGSYTVTVKKYGAYGTSSPIVLSNQKLPTDRNYIITNVASVASVTNFDTMNDQPKEVVAQSTQFFDGLGRLEQTVNTMASPAGKDVVQPTVIDAFGRETTKYLPVVVPSATGTFYENLTGPTYANSPHAQFYNGSTPAIPQDAAPFAKVAYDHSPLNRVVKEGAPGTAWQPVNEQSLTDRTIKKRYLSNVENEVLKFEFDAVSRLVSLPPVGANNRFYSPNQLYANVTYDEQQNDVTEYVDKEGRTICKKVKASATEYASTYYLYDEMDNLVVVIPPEAVKRFETGN